MNIEIKTMKPCPFCGGTNLDFYTVAQAQAADPDPEAFSVIHCRDCNFKLESDYVHHKTARERWNRRPSPGTEWDKLVEKADRAEKLEILVEHLKASFETIIKTEGE